MINIDYELKTINNLAKLFNKENTTDDDLNRVVEFVDSHIYLSCNKRFISYFLDSFNKIKNDRDVKYCIYAILLVLLRNYFLGNYKEIDTYNMLIVLKVSADVLYEKRNNDQLK